ncbi:MAG TPA: peroxidase family protein [Geminicoccaceae bacterium]|nr:peroxidase family protein [Geminicoccaceae bacterium]
MRRARWSRLLSGAFGLLNRVVPWHRLPGPIGVFNLLALREDLRAYNLYDTSASGASAPGPECRRRDPRVLYARTVDGSWNDLNRPGMGAAGTRFGRNFPLEFTVPEPEPALLEPSPRTISRRLLMRDSFKPAPTLNLLAAAWLQFQVHDWFSHGEAPAGDELHIPLAADDDWFENPMRIRRTPADPTRTAAEAGRPPTFVNQLSHWWDGSALYGSDRASEARVRAFEGGRLRVEGGRLPTDPATGVAITGFNDNWWIGLGLMHTLFALEHNAICARLQRAYPTWSDDRLFDTARLINAALMAKIHTVEWTPAVLANPALRIAMNANWWGLFGERLHRILGRLGRGEVLGGIPASPTDHHGVPYALTEEFVAVYRMHPLIPDTYELYALATGELVKTLNFVDLAGRNAAGVIDDQLGVADVLYSFGIAHPGAIVLHNFPRALCDFTKEDRNTGEKIRIDLGAIDVLRDRERGVPRYNQFRRLLRLPPAASFEALAADPAWAEELRDVYGGEIERVDAMVGMYAEPPPRGFGFSETAFRIFILMASRRLKSDRFFTADFTPRVYTPEGMAWIDDNDMRSVLLRHYPELAPALKDAKNAFAPWARVRG